MLNSFKYLYGPVQSWRLGRSMGVDPISLKDKICNMDCTYCQLGATRNFSSERKIFVPTEDLLNEIRSLNPQETFDCLTISGRGEPTLAANLGEIIAGIRNIRQEKITVITNSSLLWREDVREDLMNVDAVLAKVDAFDEKSFRRIDRPPEGLIFGDILGGLWKFRKCYRGYLSLDIMFVEAGIDLVRNMALLTKNLSPDHVHLNTPLRDCAVEPLSRYEMALIKTSFEDQSVTTVYDETPSAGVCNDPSIIRRHGRPRHPSTI